MSAQQGDLTPPPGHPTWWLTRPPPCRRGPVPAGDGDRGGARPPGSVHHDLQHSPAAQTSGARVSVPAGSSQLAWWAWSGGLLSVPGCERWARRRWACVRWPRARRTFTSTWGCTAGTWRLLPSSCRRPGAWSRIRRVCAGARGPISAASRPLSLRVPSGSEFDMMSRRVLAACSSTVANRIAPLIRAFPCQRDDQRP